MQYVDIAAKHGYHNIQAVMRSGNRYAKYLRAGGAMAPEEFMLNEIPTPGSIKLSSIIDKLDDPLLSAVDRLLRFAKCNHYQVTDTIAGYTLKAEDAVELMDWLKGHTAIRPVWESYCANLNLPIGASEYRGFLDAIKRKNYVVCKYHPCFFYEEYAPGTEADVLLMTKIIYADEEEIDSLGYMTVKMAGNRLGVTESAMETWLIDHPQWISAVAGVPFATVLDVDALDQGWKQCVDAELYDWFDFQRDFQHDVYRLYHRRVMSVIRSELVELHLPAKSYPQQDSRKIYFAQDKIVAVTQILCSDYLVPVSAFESAEYTSVSYITDAIRQGKIDGEKISQTYFLRPCWFIDSLATVREYISVETTVRTYLEDITSAFDVHRTACWDDLFRFCDHSGWWGIWHADHDPNMILYETKYATIYIRSKDVPELCRSLNIWLQTYGQMPAEEFVTRLEICAKDFPVAVRKLRKAFPDAEARTASVCEMIDMLFSMLGEKHQDIDTLAKSKRAIEDMIDRMRAECSIAASRNCVDFLSCAGYFSGTVSFRSLAAPKDVTAYSVANFTIIAAAICSPDIWEEQNLVQKAVQNPHYARLWVYVALHIFSALRSTDYKRLQPPILEGDPREVLRQIETGTFSAEEARKLSVMFASANSYFRRCPNKTADTQNVLPLYFHVPTNCETQFGIILAIALAHYAQGAWEGNFIVPPTNLAHQKEFFGTPFAAACENTAFSGRRANKALMQLVSVTAQEELSLSPDIAYSLASSLRSHKGGYAKLSETTYRYLHNSQFSGLSGDYVIHHMFQRGTCSFILDHLLKTYFKDLYQDLPIHLQTEAIQKLGLSALEASEIERNVVLMLADTEHSAVDLVSTAAASGEALSNLIAGKAKARGGQAECLLKALGQSCVRETYQHCAGCQYEVRNKMQYVHYYAEFMRLSEEIALLEADIQKLKHQHDIAFRHEERSAIEENLDMLDQRLKKSKWLRKEVIYPCLIEIDSHIRSFADDHILESYRRLQKSLVERNAANGA